MTGRGVLDSKGRYKEARKHYVGELRQDSQTEQRKARVMYEWERRGDKKIGETSRTAYKENGTRSHPLYGWPGSASGSQSLGDQDLDHETKTKEKGKDKGKAKSHGLHVMVTEDEGKDEQELADDVERQIYLLQWAPLLSHHDNDVELKLELRYDDIPWPIYNPSPLANPNPSHLSKKSIQSFLSDLALFQCTQTNQSEEVDLPKEEKKVLREAIRNYHPDRFLTKILPRVRESEQEKVKAGMEKCSRVLTELIMENSQ